MKNARVLLTVGALVVLVSLWAGAQFAGSAPKASAPVAINHRAKPADILTSHGGAKKTYIESGQSLGIDVKTETYVKVGSPIKVTCPGTGTCDLEIDQSIQYSADGDTNEFISCYKVDADQVGLCWNSGDAPGPFTTLTWSDQHSVAHGTHTVQFEGRVEGNTQTVTTWTNEVRVYEP